MTESENQNNSPGGDRRWVFVGEPLSVQSAGEIPQPVSFIWRGREYSISEILLSWFDWGFPAGAKQRDWKSRRHRRYFRVVTASGETFEIYLDRRGRGPEWICFQRLTSEAIDD